jgi:photosystem II stability/assembly factor-like uncharacterized protein
MRSLVLLLAAAAFAQSTPQVQLSHTSESLRGVSAVSREIAWASGTHGTYLRTTDAGRAWTPAQVPDAATLDFRAVAAFSADEAFLMSAGPGDQSRIYHTSDAGRHWQLQFTNSNPKGFFDSMAFWNPTHGVVLGDPIPDESGQLKFELLITADGQTWQPIPSSQLPPAFEGEGAFAASNTCIAILKSGNVAHQLVWGQPPSAVQPGAARQASAPAQQNEGKGTTSSRAVRQPESTRALAPGAPMSANSADPNIWFATGGKAARVFHSADHGQTWRVFDTPILHGPDSAGIFSIAFRDALHGVIAGGDYKHPDADGPNLAFTGDGGKTWTLSPIHPQVFFSAVAYDRHANETERRGNPVPTDGKKPNPRPTRLLLVAQDFIFDLRPPSNPRRLTAKKNSGIKFNAISPYPQGGALIVGPNGSIATIP